VKRSGGVHYVWPLRCCSLAGVILEELLRKQRVVVERVKTVVISKRKCILVVL
jgi:hypothetical protein